MNKLFGNSYQVRGHDAGMNPGLTQKGLPFQSESLFGMALYDFDTLAADAGFQSNVNLPVRHNLHGPPPVFHLVDEYKDLSLREILDLSDDFISNEEDQLLGHCHNSNNVQQNDFRQDPNANQFSNGNIPQFLPNGSMIESADLNNMNQQDQYLAFNLEQQLMPRKQQSQLQQQIQQQNMHHMQHAPVPSFDSLNSKKHSRDFGDDADDLDMSSDPKDRRFRPYQAGQWSEKFEELCEYRRRMGHCLVPHTFSENLSLARWVKRQRYQYKLMIENKSSTMTPDRVAALDEIGFVWDSQGAAWGDRLGELHQFRQTYMHCNVPSNFSENPRLATWIKCQRRQYKLFMDGKPSNMTPQRIQHLENLGFEWELRTYKKQRVN